MTKLDVWTVWITFSAQDEQTRADVSLQGPAVELECSGLAPSVAGRTEVTLVDSDLAAARALEDLSRRLFDRAAHDGHIDEQRERRA